MSRDLDLAIVGMAGRFPGAASVDAFWRNLVGGVESISRFTDEEVLACGVDADLLKDPRYVRAGGVLADVDLFDAAFFGFTPREAEITDPQQRVFLECAWEALEHAGYDTERYRRPIGVYAGMSMNTYVLSNLIYNPRAVESVGAAQAAIGNIHDHLATRVSYRLDLRGPAVTVQTACSTSLVAIHFAVQALVGGECDMALAGGVSIGIPQHAGYLYKDGGTHSPDGHCRAFDAGAAGMIGGHGAGIVVLKRLEDALADGDRVIAVVKGSAINNDGAAKVGYTAPSVDGQARVIRAALRAADVTPDRVGYVEAHGTGTPIGDPIEVEALARVFSGLPAASCGLGSVKTNIGHLDAAAGVAGLIKTALALQHRCIPASLHFTAPSPRLNLGATPFALVDRTRDWDTSSLPRVAGVSSFGIGGTNAHVVLEEAPADMRPAPIDRPQLYVLSARTPAALEQARLRLADHLAHNPELRPDDAAWTLQVGRRTFLHRLAVVGHTLGDAAARLAAGHERTIVRGEASGARDTVFMFPGQGTQHPGMGAAMYARFADVRDIIDRGAALLQPLVGCDLRDLIAASPSDAQAAERLRRTELTQPALFLVEYAIARWLMDAGVTACGYIGHSIGEYVGACLAGVFTFEDALRLVAERGRLMSEAPEGAMLAVALTDGDARALAVNGISVAAVNGPAASVLSGDRAAIERLEDALRSRGIAAVRLHTSHAFHSHLVEDAAARFQESVRACMLQPPHTPFVSNVTGTWITAAEATDPSYWAHHLRVPVRFADGLATIASTHAAVRLVEVGPGHTLVDLARQTARAATLVPTLPRPADEGAADASVLAALGRLWVDGVRVDWTRLHDGAHPRRTPLPSYPFERQRYWIDPIDRQPSTRTSARTPVGGVQFYAPVWKRDPVASRRTLSEPSRANWLVLGDPRGLGAAIADGLARAGHRVHHVPSDRVPSDAYGYVPLLRATSAPDVIVNLLAAEDGDAAFTSLVALGQGIGRVVLSSPLRLEVVSTGRHDVLGIEALEPHAALITGPLRVIPQEYPNVRSRNVDVTWTPDITAIAGDLLAELSRDIDEQDVAIRNGQRWTLDYHAIAPRAMSLVPTGAHVIFGGFGNIGRVAARALAARGPASLVLVGRSADDRDPLVDDLRAAGAQLLVVRGDVSDRRSVRSAFEAAVTVFGRVAGVIHAAGAAGDRAVAAIADTDAVHVARHFDVKVRGVDAIACAAREFAPDYVLLTSSLSSILGGLGFGAYASANAVLDLTAALERRSGSARWVSVNWDGWRFDSPTVADSIDAFRGAAAFNALLDGLDHPQVLATAGDLSPRLARWINPGTHATDAASERDRVRRTVSGRSPATDLERLVLDTWHELLGIEGIALTDDFFALGGHSLLATQLVARLRRALGVDVPLRLVFDHHVAGELAGALARLERPATAVANAAIIPRRARDGDVPLSSQQKRVWFLHQLEPANTAYVIPGIVRVSGPLATDVLGRALHALTSRHEALRTTFVSREGRPAQVIAGSGTIPVHVRDARADQLDALVAEELATPFDLTRGPLVRATVLRVAPDDHLVILAMHHLVSDGWSIAVLIRELVALYDAEGSGRPATLPPVPLQYADYAAWQEEWRERPEAAEQLAYWTRHLAALPRIELATDRPRAPVSTSAGGSVTTRLDAETTAALRRLCAESGTTIFMALVAGYAAWLHRYTGQTDLPIGTPSANRHHAELEGTIGFFVNSLVIRADASGEPSFRELLDRVKRTSLEAWAHQDAPFEQLVDALQPERTPGWDPLFQVMFVLQNAPQGRLEISGLQFEPFDVSSVTAKFDLSLYAVETGDEIALLLEFRRDLFDEDTARRMLAHYERLVASALADPARPIADLTMLSADELTLVTRTWNRTATDYPRTRSVHALFAEQAARTPHATAATFLGASLSYRELDRRANDVAARLRAAGARRGAVVGLAVDRSLEMLAAILGILKAGSSYLPLDASDPAERLSLLLREGSVRHLVVQAHLASALPSHDCRVLTLDSSGDEADAVEDVSHPTDPAYVMFTSGSTGPPKGVVVPHRAIVRLVRGTSYVRLGEDEVILQFAPLAFDASTFEIWGALLNGGTVAIAPAGPLSLADLGRTLTSARVTTAWLTAGLFHQFAEHQLDALKGLGQLVAGGDVLQPAAVTRVLTGAPGVRMVNGFGPTEATTFACCHTMTSPVDVGHTVPIGLPIANTRAYILDARGNPAPVGVRGELFIGGDGVAQGYLQQAALTAERFVPDPYGGEAGGRLYRTGDLARWLANGTIEFLGRRDVQVKVRGFRVEPGEIEAALLACPGVTTAFVTARVRDDGDTRLVAYVAATAEVEGEGGSALQSRLRRTLPAYMVPASIVVMQALPLTPSGKVDRHALPEPDALVSLDSYAGPRTPEEADVAAIWRDVLNVPQVGIEDNFFMLGGHSLLATQVMARVLERFGVEIPLRALFAEPTVSALAREILRARADVAVTPAGIQSIPRSSARRRTGSPSA